MGAAAFTKTASEGGRTMGLTTAEIGRRGNHVSQRSLAFFQTIGERLASGDGMGGGRS